MNGKQLAHLAVISPEQANLPADVLSAIPLQSIQNSPVGNPPEDLWHQIVSTFTNLVISAAQFIYNGLVAVGNFLAQAADVVNEFAMKLWNTAVSAVKQAVEAVKKAVDSLLDAVKEIVVDAIERLIKPLIDAYSNYREGVKTAIQNLIRKYHTAQKLIPEMVMGLNDAIMQPFFYGIVVLGIGIWTAITLIQGVSLGIGMFIGPLVGAAMMVVMDKVFKDNKEYGKIGLPRPSLDFDSVWSEIDHFLHKKKVKDFMFSLLEALISTIGFIFSLPAVSEAAGDASGTSAAMLSYTVGFFSLIVSYIATALVPVDESLALGAGSLAVALGIESAALGVIGLRNTEINGNLVLSLIGMGLSGISIIMFLTLS